MPKHYQILLSDDNFPDEPDFNLIEPGERALTLNSTRNSLATASQESQRDSNHPAQR
jgi:hypothetical protein